MQFWKMQGLGNDFIVVDNRNSVVDEANMAGLARRLCERHLSIGADGLLLFSNSAVADVKMRVFNADGSEAEMCGNGIRCLAKYCYESGIAKKSELTVQTLAGVKQVWITAENGVVKAVKVDMGMPVWTRSQIPMRGEGICINCDLQVDEENYKATCLSMGNPHCVIFVEKLDEFPVEYVGHLVENHEAFPNRTNVEFVQLTGKNELKVRVWERGCGETLACGTGACAAAVAANRLGKVGGKVKVRLTGGDLQVEVADHVFMTGPAEKVFEGKVTVLHEVNANET
jgi:diaminopimelate epimerase